MEKNRADPLPVQELSEPDRTVLAKTSKTIRKQRASVRAKELQLDRFAHHCQQQIEALSKEREHLVEKSEGSESKRFLEEKVAEAKRQVHDEYSKRIVEHEAETSSLREELHKEQEKQLTTAQELCRARQKAADSEIQIMRLREELSEIRDSKERTAADAIEQHARNMDLVRNSRESESRLEKHQESAVFLKAEVNRLSRELAKTRTLLDAGNASHDAAISSANRLSAETARDLASANIRAQKIASELADVERKAIDMQANFEREKSDQRSEIESLTKLVDMHREAAKDAEIRLSGYSEVLATLAKERKESEKRESPTVVHPVDRHAEALFKDLNQALDAKLHVLEQERHELVRARAREARMATKHQALLREADGARREIEDMRQQVATLEAELGAQKDKTAELERRLLYNSATVGAQTPSTLPFSIGQETGSAAHGLIGGPVAAETPSPFRRSGRLAKAEEALAGMMDLKRRHEAILAGLRGRRDEYANLLNE